ncbi:MAG: PAS domain-containing protein [Salinivirgaceae bacterium]|jgi:methyl-accepting chemotaxis protein|nr:PAS domain-containing protein [Salinivirgaceae bacterium]
MDKKDITKGLIILNVPILLILVVLNFFSYTDNLQFPLLYVFVVSLVFLGAVNVFYFLLLKGVSKTVDNLGIRLTSLAQGNVNDLLRVNEKQLFSFAGVNSIVVSVFNNLKATLKTIDKISKGDLYTEIKPLSTNDLISEKLIELCEKLKEDKVELEKTKYEEEQRNWIASGLAKFSEVLRQDSHELKRLSYEIIKNLLDYIQLNQGALYVLNENESDDIYFEISAAVAYGREKLMENKIYMGESMIGRCAFERKTIYMTDIPQDYINVTSGLGSANPNNLLIVPCILDGKVFGIIEVASFKLVEKFQIEFIEKLGESIASTISNTRAREKTNALLSASQHQAEELAAQEEELRQNLEEMETTQDNLKRQMEVNIEMRNELTYEKFLFDTLLEKIPARVFFKDKDCRFVKASNSALKKFGFENYSELAGMSDADLLDPEFAKKTMADERNIMETRQGLINFVEHEITERGDDIWKTVSKIPLINADDKCIGTFGIISDITEFKVAEIESQRVNVNYNKIIDLINNNWYSFVLDEKGLVKQANEQFCQLFNTEISAIQNKFINDFLKDYLVSESSISPIIQSVLSDELFQIEREYIIKSKKIKLREKYVSLDVNKTTKEILMIGVLDNK